MGVEKLEDSGAQGDSPAELLVNNQPSPFTKSPVKSTQPRSSTVGLNMVEHLIRFTVENGPSLPVEGSVASSCRPCCQACVALWPSSQTRAALREELSGESPPTGGRRKTLHMYICFCLLNMLFLMCLSVCAICLYYIYIYVAAEAPPGAYQRRPFLPSEH